MDAGNNIAPLAGRYFLFGSSGGGGGGKGKFGLSVLPWLGIEYKIVNGEVSFVPPGPLSTVTEEIENRYVFPLVGLNVKATLFHFIDAEVKYAVRFDADVYFSDVSAIANVFFTTHWGSRRCFMERSAQTPMAAPSSAMTSEAFPWRKMSDTSFVNLDERMLTSMMRAPLRFASRGTNAAG
jgi:hypothetical protein